jgi:hypothetical protein
MKAHMRGPGIRRVWLQYEGKQLDMEDGVAPFTFAKNATLTLNHECPPRGCPAYLMAENSQGSVLSFVVLAENSEFSIFD